MTKEWMMELANLIKIESHQENVKMALSTQCILMCTQFFPFYKNANEKENSAHFFWNDHQK